MAESPGDRALDALSTDGLEAIPEVLGSPRFVIGDTDPERIRIRYFHRVGEEATEAHVWFGPRCQGPPKHAHGGSVAAVLDELMGFRAWIAGHSVVAGRLSIAYRHPTPLVTALRAVARIDRVKGRKIYVAAVLETPQGKVLADGEGLFVEVDLGRFRAGFPSEDA